MADIYGMLMGGLRQAELGAESKKRKGLAELMGEAYGAPQAQRQQLLGQAVAIDPDAGFAAQKQFGEMDDNKRAQVARHAQLFAALPDEQKAQAYPQLAAEVGSLTGQQLPGAYDAKFMPMIQQVAAWSGGEHGLPAGIQEFQFMSKGLQGEDEMRARRIALGLDPRQSSAAISYQKVRGEDGVERLVAVDPRAVGAQVVGGGDSYGSGVPSPSAGMQKAPGDVQGLVKSLAGQYGGQVSSLQRSPEHNARVGGVANSQHIAGTAGDVVVPQPLRAQFMAAARAQGLEAIDEGDHVHLELPPGARRSGANPFAGRRPEDEAAAVEDAKRRVEMDYLPKTEGIKADAAVGQALAIDRNKAGVEMEKVGMERGRDANATLALLDDAESLVKMSTGSAVGNARDSALGMLGKSTKGGEAISALQTIAGQLTSKMPRMQGPQSDRDVELYKQMAGDLANPTLPRGRRLAALAQIRKLNEKYATPQQQAAPGSTGGWGIRAKK